MNESIDDLQKALDDDDELGGPTVLSSLDENEAHVPPPRQPPVRATPMPAQQMPVRPTPNPVARQTPNPTTRPSSIMTSAPVRPTPMPQRTTPPPMAANPMMAPRQTPPYGMQVARGTPAAVPAPMPMPPSPFEESSSSMGYDDSFSSSFTEDDAATQLASASYDDQVVQSLYANTPRPGSPPPVQQHAAYEPAYEQPPVRPSMRLSQPTPVPQAPDNPDMAARLARLQGLSLERPAVATATTSSSSGGSSKLPWILLALVVIGGGAYHFYAVSKAEKSGGDTKVATQPSTPTTSNAGATSAASSLLASGYVAAKAPITISTTVAGRLRDVNVDAGDTITKNQLLASLDDGDIRAELSLASARVRDAKRQHQRVAMLVKAQAATPSDLEKAYGALEVASAEYRIAEQKLEKTRIKSPITGTVLEVLAHPGEVLTPAPAGGTGAGVLRIADLSALIAEVDVAEAELKNVFMGQEAELTSEAQRGHTYKGIVREIAEQADRARGTVLVKVDIVGEQAPPDDGTTPPAPTEGSGSAAPPKEPEAKEPPKEPEAKAPKDKRRNGRNKKEPPPAPAPAPASEPDPKDAPKATGLRPGMAVQVRFIAKKQTL